jgi:PadR family transcriptional regulator PadR
MGKTRPPDAGDILQGTLDLLILRTLILGPAHGHTIAHSIERTSESALDVEQGSLYPALHRLEDRGWVSSEWGVSDNNRRAKFYKLTAKRPQRTGGGHQPMAANDARHRSHSWRTEQLSREDRYEFPALSRPREQRQGPG